MSFDAVLCECAFCASPTRPTLHQSSRGYCIKGRVGVSDLTQVTGPLPEMDGLLAWIACVGDAQPLVSYADWLVGAGFCVQAEIARNDCLRKMVKQIRGKLLLADIMIERQFSYQGWISGSRRSLPRPRRTILKTYVGVCFARRAKASSMYDCRGCWINNSERCAPCLQMHVVRLRKSEASPMTRSSGREPRLA